MEKRFLLQISFVSGVKAQHTARKSDCFASSSKETRTRNKSEIIKKIKLDQMHKYHFTSIRRNITTTDRLVGGKFPRSQSSRAPVGCAGQSSDAHLEDLFTAFGSKRGTNTVLGRWSKGFK